MLHLLNMHRFKWGTKPVMELSLASLSKFGEDNKSMRWIYGCFISWLLLVLYLFFPFIGSASKD